MTMYNLLLVVAYASHTHEKNLLIMKVTFNFKKSVKYVDVQADSSEKLLTERDTGFN